MPRRLISFAGELEKESMNLENQSMFTGKEKR
jgi:hypothetical protein